MATDVLRCGAGAWDRQAVPGLPWNWPDGIGDGITDSNGFEMPGLFGHFTENGGTPSNRVRAMPTTAEREFRYD